MLRILLIDDHEPLRDAIGAVLRKRGYQVLEADNGKTANQLVTQNDVDLVITDLIMPDVEGFQTILGLRAAGSNVKIIAMSGSDAVGTCNYLEMAIRLGANESIAKPFEPSELLSQIERLAASYTRKLVTA